jgi:predicted deacylase
MIYKIESVEYDSKTGEFFRIFRHKRKPISGTNKKGYIQIQLSDRKIEAHRLAAELVFGSDSIVDMHIDHKDRNILNNKISNLRIATASQNLANSKKSVKNTSGHKGVYKHSLSCGWVAQIRINKKITYLGIFNTPEKAKSAYDEAAETYFGEFACNA